MANQLGQKNQDQPAKSVSDQAPAKNTPTGVASTAVSIATSTDNLSLYLPINEALTRVTKKPFGIYVSPKDSPVSPERFTGYHTGVDFETMPQEQDIDVPVYAICAGPLILKKTATGYGGVAVQSCKINQEPVTVIYGHLRLTSIAASQNALLSLGQKIGVLGKGYSAETSGERKHLHLGIHKGSAVSLLGYVPDKDKLSQWLDFMALVK
jgi:hypothetical protein